MKYKRGRKSTPEEIKATLKKVLGISVPILLIGSYIILYNYDYLNALVVYHDAVELFYDRNYIKASEKFHDITYYEIGKSDEYKILADIGKYYQEGNIISAYGYLEDAIKDDKIGNFYPKYEKEIDEFYRYSKEEAYRLINAKIEKEKNEYSENMKKGIPFVGMKEKDIGNTYLGKPSDKVVFDLNFTGEKNKKFYTYKFIRGNYLVLEAICVDSEVTKVMDYRENPKLIHKPEVKNTYPKKDHSKDFSEFDDDDFDVDAFADEEDFYEEYQDEFYDYYEAEEYFNEHQK